MFFNEDGILNIDEMIVNNASFKNIMEDGAVTEDEIKAQSDKVVALLQDMETKYTEEQLAEIKNQIQTRVKQDIDKQQRDYYLQQQVRVIQEELGDSVDADIEKVNDEMPKYKRIKQTYLRTEEFEKTTTQKIKRRKIK